MDVALDFSDLAGLSADFAALAVADQNKVNRDAVLAGARVARDAIRAAAPFRTGRLRRSSVAAVARRAQTPGQAVAGVRFRPVKGEKYPPFYWKFIELGTRFMPSAPFVRPTWDGKLAEIEAATVDKLAEGIDKAIRAHW